MTRAKDSGEARRQPHRPTFAEIERILPAPASEAVALLDRAAELLGDKELEDFDA